MKFKLLIALCMLMNTCIAQQRTTTNTVKSDNTNVTLTERDNGYEMSARFNPDKTDKIRTYMNRTIAKGSSTSFTNTELDAEMKLDNGAHFYILLKPGKLELKLDKRKNSAEIYQRFKKMCLGIKDIIGEK